MPSHGISDDVTELIARVFCCCCYVFSILFIVIFHKFFWTCLMHLNMVGLYTVDTTHHPRTFLCHKNCGASTVLLMSHAHSGSKNDTTGFHCDWRISTIICVWTNNVQYRLRPPKSATHGTSNEKQQRNFDFNLLYLPFSLFHMLLSGQRHLKYSLISLFIYFFFLSLSFSLNSALVHLVFICTNKKSSKKCERWKY